MSGVVYTSEIRLERVKGSVGRAWLPFETEPITFGKGHALTTDYVVAATAGCLLGTYGAALDVRQIPSDEGRLTAGAVGEVETEDRVPVLRRIHVRFRLQAAAAHREPAERIHAVFADRCPLYRSLRAAIQISTELTFDE